jgi:large subunit ribosomal protein L8e
MYSGQHVFCGSKAKITVGNVLPLKSIPEGSSVCNIEQYQGDRGVFARTSGSYAVIISHSDDDNKTKIKLSLLMLEPCLEFALEEVELKNQS